MKALQEKVERETSNAWQDGGDAFFHRVAMKYLTKKVTSEQRLKEKRWEVAQVEWTFKSMEAHLAGAQRVEGKW